MDLFKAIRAFPSASVGFELNVMRDYESLCLILTRDIHSRALISNTFLSNNFSPYERETAQIWTRGTFQFF